MLTVYSTQGSPGASTTAMHLAAHWASAGREVLLIEADPAGGSLSHNLGIQFTPGSASFVASGLPVQSNHLIDHAQDVLFENLHVMPAPASPTGARGIFNTFADFAEDLRTISENEMAVVIDGGRLTADTGASELTTGAAGVVVVCRSNSQLSNLEHLTGVLATGAGDEGPQGCAVTVGKSPMNPDEWLENCGLTFCGSIETVSDMASDLSAYLARSKRKSKKWRASLEQVAESLYPYAQPPVSIPPRRSRPAEQAPSSATEPVDGSDQTAAGPEPSQDQDPAGYEQPPMAPPEPMPGIAPPAAPAAAAYGQSHYLPPTPESQPEGYGQSHYLPPTTGPEGYGQAPSPLPPEDFSGYGQSEPSPYGQPQYPAPPYEQHPGAYQQPPPPAYEQPPAPTYEQPPAPTSEQPQPGAYQQPPGAYQQPPPPAYEQPQYPAPPYEQPAPSPYADPQLQPPAPPETHPGFPQAPAPEPTQAYEQPHYPAPPYEQPAAHHQPPAPAPYGQAPPAPSDQPGARAPQPAAPEAETPPRPNITPTGSFRDWAAKLHGLDSKDMTARKGG